MNYLARFRGRFKLVVSFGKASKREGIILHMDTRPAALNLALWKTLSELSRELHELYGERYRGLHLYGSHARGEADEGSDVDLLLVLSGEVGPLRR